jgi:hypothetical protein
MSPAFPMGLFMFLFVAIFVIVIGGIIFNVGKGVTEWASNNAQPERNDEARVASKRTEVSGMRDSTSTSYYVTFEFSGGERRELEVDGREYGQLSEGDFGNLAHQGTRYLGFVRETLRKEPPRVEPQVPQNLVRAYCGNAIPSGQIKCDGCGWTWKPVAPIVAGD